MTTHKTTEDEWIYKVLADYSNDLYSLKKRNGMLPAAAAVQAIQKQLKRAELEGKLKMVNNADSFLRGGVTTYVDHLNFLSKYRVELEAELSKDQEGEG